MCAQSSHRGFCNNIAQYFIPTKFKQDIGVFSLQLIAAQRGGYFVLKSVLKSWVRKNDYNHALFGHRLELRKLFFFLRCLHEIKLLWSMCCGPQTTTDPVVPIGYICGRTGAHDFFHDRDSCCFPSKLSPPEGCVQNAGRIICCHGCHVCTNRTMRATPLPRSSFPGRLLFIATLDGAWKNVQRLAAYQIVLQRMSWCRHQARNEMVMKSRPCTVCIPTLTPALTWVHTCAHTA